MANIFEQYGIKEVADVMIYKLEEKDGSTTEKPWLYLDTLKVSTLEQTAEQAEARGGKGNSPLIIWDFGKEINITLEDALYSPRSMATTWGGNAAWQTVSEVEKTVAVVATGTSAPVVTYINPKDGSEVTATATFKDKDGKDVTSDFQIGETYFATYKVPAEGNKIVIDADDYPGVFKIVGDTYARNRNTGEDEYFQFIIHRAKMSAENTLTLEAEGDPTVFNLNLRTLRPKDGHMIELIQYKVTAGE